MLGRGSGGQIDIQAPEALDYENAYIGIREEVCATKLRFSASKVAAVVGLHEYGDLVEEFIEFLYQDLEELLVIDASLLQMEVTSKESELHALIRKSGADAAALIDIVRWTAETKTAAKIDKANEKTKDAQKHIENARKRKRLTADEAKLLQDGIASKVRQSVGKRNEQLAIEIYEARNGLRVHSTNDKFYFLLFPHPRQAKALASSSSQCACHEAKALERFIERVALDRKAATSNEAVATVNKSHFFSICGMIDGTADMLVISDDNDDDTWSTEPILVEVKNRMARFRDPVPLHDCIQMAVYMKMINVRHGDMVQCLHRNDETTIHISRVSLDAYPLTAAAAPCACQCTTDLWASLVVPRLYEYATLVYLFRTQDLRRLAFMQAPPETQRRMLREALNYL
ncbi:Aste57867_1584 [Aphanomyces stellatus]|uniref:Aste57867_1584 protein n=1 Tax=Aphanomyces stellatus TaxID=120398 RepID=A0A485KAZ9_9STRA|nr:hypothetical protein As57867_001583 [Aphanomyces stellatus]VFT78797.1 Aste57867_1584 [Aphanomyces stellatus]